MLDTTTEAGRRAQRRLQEEEITWLTTVCQDGQPQSVPVWFLWDGQTFLIYSQPGQQKLRNIDTNPQVDLNLNSNAHGGDVVRAEGVADIVEDAPQLLKFPSTCRSIVLPSPGSVLTPRASQKPTRYP